MDSQCSIYRLLGNRRDCDHVAAQTMPTCVRVRHALALPIYVLTLLLVFGCLAAGVAGDDWPE
jgi:hypothetical protein